ncbi:MAG TPA: hypothetical protein VIQ05_14100 [Tardiphaga sp.]
MTRSFAPTALMIGNFVIDVSLIGPTAMLGELSVGLGVSIRDTGTIYARRLSHGTEC